jgi:hypothetical protein
VVFAAGGHDLLDQVEQGLADQGLVGGWVPGAPEVDLAQIGAVAQDGQDGFVAGQRAAAPVAADPGEQPVLALG